MPQQQHSVLALYGAYCDRQFFSNTTTITRSFVMVAASLLPMSALSDEVTLTSADGSINLVGELLEFADNKYLIRTALGEFSIAASQVNCQGESCPNANTVAADVMFAGSDTVGLGMMPLLLSGYASFLNAEAGVEDTEKAGQSLTNFVGDRGYGDKLGSYLVTSTTSGKAFSALMDKSAHLGMASRRIKPN